MGVIHFALATLLAAGLSNGEIADRLVLSVRTVESHVASIYARLGVNSRVAAAAWLAQNPTAPT